MGKLIYPWNNLSVEVAVKLYESLYDGQDQASVVYEFMTEAEKIVEQCSTDTTIGTAKLEILIPSVMNESLDHNYEAGTFSSVAGFIISRIEHLQSMAQI